MMFYLIVGFSSLVLLGGAVAWWKIRKSAQEIDRLFKETERLASEKAVAETKVQHFEVRKKNEENSHRNSRDDIIDRLQQQGDLRD